MIYSKAIEIEGIRLDGQARDFYLDEEKREDILKKYSQGISVEEIAKYYETNRTIISKILRACGVKRKQSIIVNGVRLEGKARDFYLNEKIKEDIINKREQGLTQKEIANYYDTTEVIIGNVLRACNIRANKKQLVVNGVPLSGKARELYLDENTRKDILEKSIRGFPTIKIAEFYKVNHTAICSVLRACGIKLDRSKTLLINGIKLSGKVRDLYNDIVRRKALLLEILDGKKTYKRLGEEYGIGASFVSKFALAHGIRKLITTQTGKYVGGQQHVGSGDKEPLKILEINYVPIDNNEIKKILEQARIKRGFQKSKKPKSRVQDKIEQGLEAQNGMQSVATKRAVEDNVIKKSSLNHGNFERQLKEALKAGSINSSRSRSSKFLKRRSI